MKTKAHTKNCCIQNLPKYFIKKKVDNGEREREQEGVYAFDIVEKKNQNELDKI